MGLVVIVYRVSLVLHLWDPGNEAPRAIWKITVYTFHNSLVESSQPHAHEAQTRAFVV